MNFPRHLYIFSVHLSSDTWAWLPVRDRNASIYMTWDFACLQFGICFSQIQKENKNNSVYIHRLFIVIKSLSLSLSLSHSYVYTSTTQIEKDLRMTQQTWTSSLYIFIMRKLSIVSRTRKLESYFKRLYYTIYEWRNKQVLSTSLNKFSLHLYNA